jgi:hypothetical protein
MGAKIERLKHEEVSVGSKECERTGHAEGVELDTEQHQVGTDTDIIRQIHLSFVTVGNFGSFTGDQRRRLLQ